MDATSPIAAEGLIIVWQRFCEPVRLRIAYCPSLSCEPADSIMDAGWKYGSLESAHLRGSVICLSLCQTSCPLRTVHYIWQIKPTIMDSQGQKSSIRPIWKMLSILYLLIQN